MGSVNYAQLLEESGGGIELLPDGDYDAVIDTAKVQNASNGKVMFVCKFKVLTGPHAGKQFWNNFVISPDSPGALGFFFQHMATLGLGREFFAVNPPDEQVAQALVGRQARVTLGHGPVKGEVRNQCNGFKPMLGAAAAAPVAAGPAPAAGFPVAPAPVPQAPMPVAPAPVVAPAPAAPVAPPVAPMPVAPQPAYEQPAAVPQPVAPVVAPQPEYVQQPVAAPVAPQYVAPPGVPQPVAVPPLPGQPVAPVAAPEQPVAPAPQPL